MTKGRACRTGGFEPAIPAAWSRREAVTTPSGDGDGPAGVPELPDLQREPPAGWRRWAAVAATVFGLLTSLAGAVSSGVYVWAAASALGEADRSVVFWYSGFLVFGIFLTAAGVASLLMLTSELRAEQAVLPRRAVRATMWFLAGAGGLAAVAGVVLALWHLLVI